MYERAAKAASNQGLKLASDWEVSADAQRVWSALERRGYDIQRNPNAVEADGLLKTPDRSPVFTFEDKPPPGLFDDLDEPPRAQQAADLLRRCAPGGS